MRGGIQNILRNWQETLVVLPVSELFIRIVYLTLLWSTIKLLCIGNVIWGPDYLSILYDPYTGPDRFAMLLNNPAIRPYYLWYALPFTGLLLLGMMGLHNWVSRSLVAFLFVVLHYGNVEVSTGGHHLYQQILFFHILLFRVDALNTGALASLQRLLHHLGFYAIWMQIALLYFIAGYWKLRGSLWMNGDAMLMTLSFKEFGFPWLAVMMKENTWYLWVTNYIVLGYQLLFGVLIWIRPVRKPLLLLGAVFHLSIIFIIGITDFGLFMLASYSIFLRPEVAQKMPGEA